MMDISSGVVFGLLAMLGYGLSNAISQVPVKKIGSMRTIYARGLFTTPMIFAFLLFNISGATFSVTYVALAFAIAFLGFVPLVLFFRAIKAGKIGVVVPVANSSVIFTVLFSVLLFGEALSSMQVFSIAMIFAGIILVSVDFRELKNSSLLDVSSGIPYALASALLWGLVYFLFKIPVDVLGPVLTSFIVEGATLLYAALYLKARKISLALPERRIMLYVLAAGVAGALATLSYNFGIYVYDVSIVAALTFASPLVSTVYARLVYGEKLCAAQYLAALLMIAGIVLIGYF